MQNMIKFLMLIFTLIYVVSPVDACPGPIDDFLVMAMAMGAMKGRMLRGDDDDDD